MSDETRRSVPELPFRQMRGMRNIVAHDYANVDLAIVWSVATINIPAVCAVLERFFTAEDRATPPPSAQSADL